MSDGVSVADGADRRPWDKQDRGDQCGGGNGMSPRGVDGHEVPPWCPGVRACSPRRGGSLVAAAFARSADGWLLLLRQRRTALWRIAPVQREWLVALMRLPHKPAVAGSDPGTLPASNVKLLRKAGPAELGGQVAGLEEEDRRRARARPRTDSRRRQDRGWQAPRPRSCRSAPQETVGGKRGGKHAGEHGQAMSGGHSRGRTFVAPNAHPFPPERCTAQSGQRSSAVRFRSPRCWRTPGL